MMMKSSPAPKGRDDTMRQTTDIAEIMEVKELCLGLENCLSLALNKSAGNAAEVVLVLDLDETAFTPENQDGLGTSAWFEDIMRRWAPRLQESDGVEETNTLKSVLELVDAFYPRVPVVPTDQALHAILHKYNAMGVATMGLTARRPALAPATWQQMGDRCDFPFTWEPGGATASHTATGQTLEDTLRSNEHVRDPGAWDGLSFERGVWFTANVNKGSLLRAVLEPATHVVFADDSLRHLVAANAALEGHSASVACLHFTAATAAAKERLNPMNCDRQLAAHAAELFVKGDPVVCALVEHGDIFLRRFINAQVLKSAETTEMDSPLAVLANALHD